MRNKLTYKLILLATCYLLLATSSCSSSKKVKHSTYSKTDSTATEHISAGEIHSADAINTREITFTANKLTEIYYIRDTTLKDTVIYVPHYRILENSEHRQKDSSSAHTRDTIYLEKEKIITVKQEIKTKDKTKSHRGISITFMLIAALLLLIIFFWKNIKKVLLKSIQP